MDNKKYINETLKLLESGFKDYGNCNRCLYCGKPIAEDRQVCLFCEKDLMPKRTSNFEQLFTVKKIGKETDIFVNVDLIRRLL